MKNLAAKTEETVELDKTLNKIQNTCTLIMESQMQAQEKHSLTYAQVLNKETINQGKQINPNKDISHEKVLINKAQTAAKCRRI